MKCSIGYEGNAICVSCEDGRKILVDANNRPIGCHPNIYRHLQDTIAILESVITQWHQECGEDDNA